MNLKKNFSIINYQILKYIIYFFPVIIILGNGAINLALGLVSFLFLISIFFEKKIGYFDKPEFKYLLFFYLYLILNSFNAINFEVSITRTLFFFKFFIFTVVYVNFLEEKKIELKKLGFFWLIILIFIGLDLIYQSIFGYNITGFKTHLPDRNSSFFYDELVAGAFFLSLTFITLKMTINDERNLIEKFLLVFFLIVVFQSGERANFIKFFIIFFASMIIFDHKYSNSKKIIFLILISITIFFLSKTQIFKSRYLSQISYNAQKENILINKYLRTEYGSHALSTFFITKENLFFGVGNKSFRYACISKKEKVINYQKKIDPNAKNYSNGCATHPHQIYYEFLSEHGIIGTFIIFFILYKLIVLKLLREKISQINLLALIYILITFLPILPSGSFFTTYSAMLFWLNYTFYLISIKR